MSSPQQQLKELLALSQLYLAQKKEKRIPVSKEVYHFFKQEALQDQQNQTFIPSRTSSIPTLHLLTTPAPLLTEEKETKETKAPPTVKTPLLPKKKKPLLPKKTPKGKLSLQHPQTNVDDLFNDVRSHIKEANLAIPILEKIPSDHLAKDKITQWKNKKEVTTFIFAPTTLTAQEKLFLSAISQAIKILWTPTAIQFIPKSAKEWLQSHSPQLIFLPEESPQIPLFKEQCHVITLKPLFQYIEDYTLKQQLWNQLQLFFETQKI